MNVKIKLKKLFNIPKSNEASLPCILFLTVHDLQLFFLDILLFNLYYLISKSMLSQKLNLQQIVLHLISII